MNNTTLMTLLEKSGITTSNTGGLLNAEQADKFIQTTVNQSALLKDFRIENNIGTQRELETIGTGNRLLHAPAEDTVPADNLIRGVTTAKRTLIPVEVMLPYNISLKYLEENIEKSDAENTINNLFAKQFSNDLLDLSLNGSVLTNVVHPDYNFLKITDSYFAHLDADPNRLYFEREGSADWKGVVFPQLVKMMPSKHKADVSNLVLLTSFDVEEEYRMQLSDRVTALGDAYLTEGRRAQYKGITVQPVPFMEYGRVMLTSKKNLALGFGRDITVYKMLNPRARRVEYTITAKIDFNYVLTDLITYCI
ncbi:MAG TPA: hypothetical protein VFF33_03310 [Ignavibacteriaceae bacterium]|nr:hypothetical protein [Ignavibacteriaceae bacterium]